MATSADYANWLRNNQNKRGTPNYATVLRAYQEAALEESQAAQAAPAAPAAKPESGFFPALRSGATELGGGISALLGKLGLKDEATAQAEFDAAQKRAKEIFAPTEAGWTEAPVAKTLELLGGSIPYMAAPLVAGAAATTLPLTGPAALVTTLGAAGLTSAAQFTATNLSRQMEEGKKLADTDLGAAALAAVPQALLDTAAMRLIPGIGRIFGQAGIKVTPETAKEIAEQALKKTLIDYTAATGKTMGVEGLTEATQQVLERAQAGLSLTDPKAQKEYFDSFIGGAVLGGTLAVPGRYLERSDAQGKARELLGAQEAEKRKAEREAEEAKKKSPEYLLDLEARYKAAVAKKAELDAAAAKKPPTGADPAAMIAYRDAVRERDAFAKKEMAEVSREYVNRKKEIDALNSQRSQAAELAAARDVEQPAQTLPYYESAQGTLPGFEAAEATTDEATLREQLAIAQRQGNQPAVDMLQRKLDEVTGAGDYTAQVRNLRGYVDTLRERAQAATNLEEKLRIGEEFERVQKALADATKRSKEEKQAANKEIAALQKKMAAAEEAGDIPVQVKIAKQLQALGVTNVGIQDELDLGKPQALGKLAVPTDLEDFLAAQKQKEEEKAARAAEQKRQQDLAREAYERTQQTAGLYADITAAEQRKAADRAAAEAEARAENERLQRQESLVEQLVQATGAVQPQPIPLARVLSPTSASTETKIDNVTELRARLAFAQQTRNKTLAADIERRLTQLGAPFEEERGSALEMGELTRAAGVEGSLTPDAMEQNRLNRLAQRQLLSYDQLVKFIEQAREREQTAVDEKTKAQYKYRAEQLKQAAIGFAIQEINGRRRQYGLPELSQKESMRAVTGLARPLNELIARGAQMFEEPVVKRAQYRGVRLIEGAQEFERPPAGKRTFSEANFNSAAATLREQFRERVEAISGKPAAPTKQAAAPTGEPRRVVPEQRALFLTPPPETETVSLAPSALLDKGIDKAASGDDARLLRQMQEIYTQLTPEQQNTVREQAQRAADGRPLDAVYEMRGLYQLKQQEAATAAGQTTFLKPITLVTARRKIERLAQKAAALAREAEAAKAAAIELNKNKKTQVQEAQEAFDTAREQGKDLIATAKQLRLAQTQDRFAAANKVAELEIQQRELDKQWDETVAGEFAWLQTRYQFLREEVAAGRGPKKNRAELAQLEKLYPGAADRVVRVSKALDKIKKAIAAAKKEQQELLEKQAADTATTQLLKDATEAQQRIETAQQNLIKARDDERAAERAHNVAVAAEPSPPSLLEQIEAMPLGKEGVTRVFRDTNDPAVQDQATKKRSAIAREEGVYALLEKKLQEKDVENRAELQRRLNESQARLQKLHDELYDVYNNAPLKRVQGKTVAAAVSAEQLAKARHERHVAEIDAFNAEHNTARLSLPARKVGPVVRQQGVVRQEGERVIQAEPSTPIEGIVKIRQRLAEIALQLTYIKENKAASKEGRTKQAAAKKKLGEEKTELSVKLRELLKAQRAVVSEEKAIQTELKGAKKVVKGSIRRLKLEATDAQLFEDLADANKTQEQKQLFERAENAFGVMSATEQAFVRKQANAIVGRRLDAYKGETLAEIVALAERRMARQEDVELSRGATANPSTTDSVRTELKPHFPDLGRVQVYDSVEALVKANPQYEGRIPDDARGFVDRAGNKAFLIAGNINQGQALSVLLHEVGAHIGMKNLLGDAQYNALVKAVQAWEKRNDASQESRVARAARARVEAAETPASQVNDELLAYAVEEAVNAGVKPMETKGALGQWLSQIATLFRKALEKFGMAPEKLDAQGLIDLAFGAAKIVMQPAVPQMSRRQFLRGAGAALGAMKLPPLSKNMQLDALEAAWNASMDAAYTWFDAAKATAKTSGLNKLIKEFDLDVDNESFATALYNASEDLYHHIHYYSYGNLSNASEVSYHDREYLKEHGVKAVAELQQALQAQRTAVLDAVKKYGEERGALPEVGELFFSKNLPTASRVASNLVGGQKGFVDKLRDNFLGMGVRTQYIDKLFPTEEALKRGGVNDKDAMQAMYYLRMYDQRMHFTSQAVTVGVPERVEKTRRDGTKEFLIEAKDGANLNQAFDILKRKNVVKEAGSADAANKLVTLYMAAIRGERVGYDTLNFGRAWASAEIARIEGELKSPKLSAEQRTNLTKRKDRLSKRLDSMPSPADIKAAKAEIDANPVLREAFNEVRDIYNQYNRDLLNFNVQTGAISRELANKLLQESDYIPYYRVRDGVAELLIGKETPIRIGNLKDSPHLQELVGGDEPVMDFITSSIQNTSMLIDMATHNLAMRNLMFEFRDVGLATIGKTKGGKAPEGAVTFKVDGVEHYGVVDTEMLGISSDLLVKGLAGIPTMFPTMVRVMGMPARFLRRLIVASPVYMARQLFRDSLGASIASGANTVPLLSALKQIGKTDVLEKRGITGGQVFTGMPEDMSRMIKDMQAGKISFNNGLAWLESKAAQADALTRRSQYESYLQQGLSEMEATYMALESMNFSRRGLSPSIHMASALIPFFNTQIQGLDVLYRSFRGKMPMNERLNVRRKLLVRGAMLFGLSFAYALAMQDDEAYKNAKPEDKYGNWFVPLDMFGIKEPLRLPIPFELGYFFKALPEAIVNIATNEKGAEEAQKALKHIGQQIVPGLSNYFIPQAVKPALEVAFGSSIYTGRDIEPAREQGVEPGYRTQSSTTELAKAVGEMTGFSPIKLEFLIRGYTGQMGMAAIAALSAPFAGAGEGPAPATKRYSDLPLIGTLFQPKDASGIVDLVYERMNKVRQAQETYERFISEGKQEKAAQYAKEKADELSLASVAGAFRQQMGEITDYERRVRASNLSPERKREELDRATQAKITLSKTVQAMSGRRTPQAAPA